MTSLMRFNFKFLSRKNPNTSNSSRDRIFFMGNLRKTPSVLSLPVQLLTRTHVLTSNVCQPFPLNRCLLCLTYSRFLVASITLSLSFICFTMEPTVFTSLMTSAFPSRYFQGSILRCIPSYLVSLNSNSWRLWKNRECCYACALRQFLPSNTMQCTFMQLRMIGSHLHRWCIC